MGLVLIVDDEQDIADGIKDAISSHHIVKDYRNPSALLEDLKTFTMEPAAIMTDLKMPGMDGLSMVEKLIEMGIRSPVILFSGYLTKEDAVRGLRLGVRRIIEKPFNFDHSLELLNEVILEETINQSSHKVKLLADKLHHYYFHFLEFAKTKLTESQFRDLFHQPIGEPFGVMTYQDLMADLERELKESVRTQSPMERYKQFTKRSE